MNTGPFGCCQLHFDLIVGQQHFVVAWTGYFGVVAESGTIAAVRIISRTRLICNFPVKGISRISPRSECPVPLKWVWLKRRWNCLYVGSRHSIHTRELIDTVNVMRNGIGIRTYLYDTKRSAAPGNVCPIPFVPMIGFTRSVFCAIIGMLM